MTPKDHEPHAPNATGGEPLRRPYQAPKLRRLGSVRELTLGTNNGKPEGLNSRMPGM